MEPCATSTRDLSAELGGWKRSCWRLQATVSEVKSRASCSEAAAIAARRASVDPSARAAARSCAEAPAEADGTGATVG